MRHAKFGKKLSRDTNARKALANNLASAVILNGQITTTVAKAKFAKGHIEKLVTLAKKNKLNTDRVLASKVSKSAFIKLTHEIGPGFSERNGGYIRIVKLSQRRGDSAPMAKLEFSTWDKTKTKVPKTRSTKVKATKSKGSKKPVAKTAKKSTSAKNIDTKKVNKK